MKRILLIDDDPADHTLVKKHSTGARVSHAFSMGEAFKRKDINKFDYIIVDINLGNDNGYEVYHKLKPLTAAKFFITSGLANFHEISLGSGDSVLSKSTLIKILPALVEVVHA